MLNIPIVQVKMCPICGNIQTWTDAELRAPVGWTYFAYKGFRGFVCSNDCIIVARRTQDLSQRPKLTLPPEVVI